MFLQRCHTLRISIGAFGHGIGIRTFRHGGMFSSKGHWHLPTINDYIRTNSSLFYLVLYDDLIFYICMLWTFGHILASHWIKCIQFLPAICLGSSIQSCKKRYVPSPCVGFKQFRILKLRATATPSLVDIVLI